MHEAYEDHGDVAGPRWGKKNNMTLTTMGNLSIESPEEMSWSETMVTMRSAPAEKIRADHLLQNQAVVARPNIVVKRCKRMGPQTVEAIVEALKRRLAAGAKDVRELKTTPLRFKDGNEGLLLSYLFPSAIQMLRRHSTGRISLFPIGTVCRSVPVLSGVLVRIGSFS